MTTDALADGMTTAHIYDGSMCSSPDCRDANGWQCAECGHYFPRSRIRDIDGEYYCRRNQGHNQAGVESARRDGGGRR